MAEHVVEPVPGPRAFASAGPAAEQSQAAILLAMGMQLRADAESLQARAAATPGVGGAAILIDTDAERFPLPPLRSSTSRFTPEDVTRSHPTALAGMVRESRALYGDSAARGVRAGLAEQVYQDGAPESAAALFDASLRSPEPLVRVAAAASYLELSSEPEPLIQTLADGVLDPDPLVRDVAATALARVEPTHPALRPLLLERPAEEGGSPSRGGLIVHGTFARSFPWWQPGGDFHEYLRGLRPGLYGAPDRFDWTGGYSDAARSKAGSTLRQWVADHQMDGLDLFTHSHGGSAAMLATQAGMKVGTLVMLSCPVHTHKYYPDFRHANRIVSIRVHMDLVILADRGGQRFQDARIEENQLPVWFNHSATHHPDVWARYEIPRMI
jgi:hypothetical protein